MEEKNGKSPSAKLMQLWYQAEVCNLDTSTGSSEQRWGPHKDLHIHCQYQLVTGLLSHLKANQKANNLQASSIILQWNSRKAPLLTCKAENPMSTKEQVTGIHEDSGIRLTLSGSSPA